MTHKEQLIQRTREYLDSQNWLYDVAGDENDRFLFNFNIGGKLQRCRMIVAVDDTDIRSIAFCPLNATADVYDNVVEYITRLNYELKLGKFRFDHRDGEVSYQTCLTCIKNVPDMKELEIMVDIPFLMLKRYGDGLVKNLMGFGDPQKDVEEMED